MMTAPIVIAIIAASVVSGSNVQEPPRPSTRIAIVTPSVQGVAGEAAAYASSVRDLFASYLTGPSIQVIQLQARLASQAMEEAKQQNCDRVLTASLTLKRGGNGFGKVMGQAAGTASWAIPGGGTTKSAIARGAAITTAQAVATFASNTRAKDEFQLECRVSSSSGGSSFSPKTEKRKAKVDGEDLLTPLVEKASEAIAAAVVK